MASDPTQIELTAEQKQRVAAMADRQGKGYVEVIDELLAETSPFDAQQAGSNGEPVSRQVEQETGLLPAEEWVAEFTRIIDLYSVNVPNVDDSRESIYEDR